MLSTESIFNDNDFLKVEEFLYHILTFQTIQKIDKAA